MLIKLDALQINLIIDALCASSHLRDHDEQTITIEMVASFADTLSRNDETTIHDFTA